MKPSEKAFQQLAVYNLERKYLKNENRSIYIPLEKVEINWFFNPKQVGQFDYLWNEGLPIKEIARRMKRPILEVVLLLVDRDYHEKIKPRRGGIWGV